MEAKGLGYNTLKEINPKLVMTAITPSDKKARIRIIRLTILTAAAQAACRRRRRPETGTTNHAVSQGGYQAEAPPLLQ